MVVVTTTTPTLLSVVATGLSQLIYMFQVAHLQLRPCSMESSSCRRRSTGARISRFGGLNKSLLCLSTSYISFFLYLWKNKTKLCWLILCKLSLLSVRRLFSRDCCSRQAISGVILYPFAKQMSHKWCDSISVSKTTVLFVTLFRVPDVPNLNII